MSLRIINHIDRFMYAEAAKNSYILLRFAPAYTDYVREHRFSGPHCFTGCHIVIMKKHTLGIVKR